MARFEEVNPSRESYWRSIILFGRNVASYKFALAKSLLEFAEQEITEVTLEELAEPFSRHIKQHLQINDKQGTFSSSKFLEACRRYDFSDEALIRETVSRGFQNVIDAFHIVNQGEIPIRFFNDERRNGNRIVITDDLLRLKESLQFQNLPLETEARWRLVETAWSMHITTRLLEVQYDENNLLFYVRNNDRRRVDVTSSRDALNGYQKGKCFYCQADISVDPNFQNLADVDHFFPFALSLLPEFGRIINGVWNLVLACRDCNRGAEGKFSKVPDIKLLERLHERNNYLIASHHPLRETLISQTGATAEERRSFLQRQYNLAKSHLATDWTPKTNRNQTSQALTINYYNKNAEQFFQDTVGINMDASYAPFLAHIPEGGNILDAGRNQLRLIKL
jgi:hypothetical protein